MENDIISFYFFSVIGCLCGLILAFLPDIIHKYSKSKKQEFLKNECKIVSIKDVYMRVDFKIRSRKMPNSTILSDINNPKNVITIEDNFFYSNRYLNEVVKMQEVIYLTEDGEYLKDIKFAESWEYERFRIDSQYNINQFEIDKDDIEQIKLVSKSTVTLIISLVFLFVVILFYNYICNI